MMPAIAPDDRPSVVSDEPSCGRLGLDEGLDEGLDDGLIAP